MVDGAAAFDSESSCVRWCARRRTCTAAQPSEARSAAQHAPNACGQGGTWPGPCVDALSGVDLSDTSAGHPPSDAAQLGAAPRATWRVRLHRTYAQFPSGGSNNGHHSTGGGHGGMQGGHVGWPAGAHTPAGPPRAPGRTFVAASRRCRPQVRVSDYIAILSPVSSSFLCSGPVQGRS